MVNILSKNVISVVTVVLNDVDNIEATIQNVLSQVRCDIEYIVIDGGSLDGTINVVKKYRDKIQYFSSEKDAGIYYAMNKAISVANGNWLIFMNSGDMFYSPTVVCDVFDNVSPNVDVIYGQLIVKYGNNAMRKVIPNGIEDLWKGMISSHQTMFIRTILLKTDRFDCNFKLAADYELVSKMYHLNCHFLYVPKVIAVVSAGGVSDTMRKEVFKEYTRVSAKYFTSKPYRIYFILKRTDCFIRALAKKVLPKQLIRLIQTTK